MMLSSVLVLLSLQNSLLVNGTRQGESGKGQLAALRLLMSTCENGTENSYGNSTDKRREIRQLSAGEVGKLSTVFQLGTAEGGNGSVEEESYCFESLPYWDYRIDLELTHPEHSSIFNLLSLLAHDRSPSIIPNQSTIPLFEPSQPFTAEQSRALELARRDASGILQSLMVVLSGEEMPIMLGKGECMSSDPHWLHWEHTQSKCRAVAVEPATTVMSTVGITPGETTQQTTTESLVGEGPKEQLWPTVGQKLAVVDSRGKVTSFSKFEFLNF